MQTNRFDTFINKIPYTTIFICSIFSILFIYYIGEPWWYINYDLGKDGGSLFEFVTTESSHINVYAKSGGEFKKLVQRNNVAIYTPYAKNGEMCNVIDLSNAVTISQNNVKITFEAGVCREKQEGYPLPSNYYELGQRRGNLVFKPPGKDFKYELDDSKPIEPVGIDCIAYEDNPSSGSFGKIEFAIRVKNTDTSNVTKKLECELKNLPTGSYRVSSFAGGNNPVIITIP
jgi:hypothetical protein